MTTTHETLARVTRRIQTRSTRERTAYLQRIDTAARKTPSREQHACANLAHAFAAAPAADKAVLRAAQQPSIAIVSAYNDMRSAHQPLECYPALIKKAVRDALLASETASYHGPGTCTFYGTANTNQMLLEINALPLIVK
jgi:phosphogluconate dehydratase